MKLLISLFTLFFAFPVLAAEAEIGQPAPAFSATDTKGNAVSLEALKGKTVVLEWNNHLCPFVKKFYSNGDMQRFQKQAKEAGTVWIRVISSAPGKQGHLTAEQANTLMAEQGVEAAHTLLDESGTIGRTYGAKTTPHMYVINPEGVLVYQGAIDDKASADSADIAGATNYVMAALSAVAAGTMPDITETRAYGCSVKY